MYDEKWFGGLVVCRGSKSLPYLGINPGSFKEYHKTNFNKVMGIAFTTFTFVDFIENGGVSENLCFFWEKGKKVSGKIQRADERQSDGNIRYSGEVIRKKGDV